MSRRQLEVTPDLLLRAYGAGVFPMAESRHSDRLYWLDPALRGVLPLDAGFHLPRRLKRTALSARFARHRRPRLRRRDPRLRRTGAGARRTPGSTRRSSACSARCTTAARAHSVETWQDGRLVGGLYGVALGGAFFGESMFSRATDASKVALVHLVARLRLCGFVLLDTQFLTTPPGALRRGARSRRRSTSGGWPMRWRRRRAGTPRCRAKPSSRRSRRCAPQPNRSGRRGVAALPFTRESPPGRIHAAAAITGASGVPLREFDGDAFRTVDEHQLARVEIHDRRCGCGSRPPPASRPPPRRRPPRSRCGSCRVSSRLRICASGSGSGWLVVQQLDLGARA